MMSWVSLYTRHTTEFDGYAPNATTVNQIIQNYEITTTSTFRVFRRNKGYTEESVDYQTHRILWQDTGIPYMVLGYDVRECQYGPDRSKQQKNRYKARKERELSGHHPYVTRSRKLAKPTKKIQCPATINVKRIRSFPSYQISGTTSNWKRKKTAKKLRSDLIDPESVLHIDEYHIILPNLSDHENHLTGEFAGYCQPVDKVVSRQIKALAADGVENVSEMKRHINIFTQEVLFPDCAVPETRRFKPTEKDIRNHMRTAINEARMLKTTSLGHVRNVLVDLSGTLHIDDREVPGSVDALQRLRSTGVNVKFVTNTTKESKNKLLQRLTSIGFDVTPSEIFTSLTAARNLVMKWGVRPLLMVDRKALEDFDGINTENPNAVVIGLAPEDFHYEALNRAFRLVLDGAPLIAIHKARYYKRADDLALGPGPFVTALEYATDKTATVVGKPEKTFFTSAIEEFSRDLCDSVMIGDDARDDVNGATQAGMMGILVKTGKYLKGDEEKLIRTHTNFVVDSFSCAVDLIIDSLKETKVS